jgi:acetylornithine deacetylase/succinyl-diaminopimelate desuccinylase-like protein
MRLRSFLPIILTLAALQLAAGQRPAFQFETDEAFDAATIPAYGGSHEEVYRYIDANREKHLEALQRWVRQPSISAQNDGVVEMATMLRDDLLSLGFKEARIVPTSGHPGVWGFYDAGKERTLVVYMMYDVQPVNPEDWKVPPFAGEIVENEHGRVLMARGATNQKGPERAFLNAIEAIIETTGMPVNLMVLAEGEEELGSPHYPELIETFKDRLAAADGVLFPFNSQGAGGETSLNLGVKGILYFELEARGGEWGGPAQAEVHGSYKAITSSPALRLIQAIASMTSPDGDTILVPGYYDAIRPPTLEEQRLVNGMAGAWSRREPSIREALGISSWIDGRTGRESLMDYLFLTTLNVDGLWAGYTGEGVKTILPHKATAKIDSRLVPDQDPDAALALIRKHLDANGFADLEIRKLSGYPPAQTSVDAPLVRAAIGVFNKHGLTPSVTPRLAGSAPYYVFTDLLELPLVTGGLGFGTGAHAPNEFMVIDPAPGSGIAGLAAVEKFYVDLLHALASGD